MIVVKLKPGALVYKLIALLVFLCALNSTTLYAAAFDNVDATPVGAGSANAVVAGTGSISDALYNPASLAWQEGVQIMFSNKSRYKNNNVETVGGKYEGDLPLGARNSYAISWLPKGGSLGVSASVSVPYDTRVDWSSPFPALGEMNLKMKRYSTDVFWRVNNTLGVVLGADIYRTNLLLRKGTASFSGADWSDVGAHAGLRWEFMPFWTLGLHYRQGVAAKVKNSLRDAVTIDLPDEINIGVAHGLMDDEILMELDVKHSKWSVMKNINVTNSTTNLQTNLLNLRDTTDVMLGMTWFWRHDTQLRFGYAYEQGANKSVGYQPLLSDSNGHKITMGFGGEMATMHFDVTWTGAKYSAIDTSGLYAGKYTDARYSMMFSLSKKF